jgi:L-serine dehydratase
MPIAGRKWEGGDIKGIHPPFSKITADRGGAIMGIFDVMGPVMIGPSSSHTAGAARLGYMARLIYGKPIKKVQITLYNSFAETYHGHGTDLAVVGGLLGLPVDSPQLRNALTIAEAQGIRYTFVWKQDLAQHPNTVKFLFYDVDNEGGSGSSGSSNGSGNESGHAFPAPPFSITGNSIGGGNVRIVEINGHRVDYSGYHDVLMITYQDLPGMIGFIGDTLGTRNINIAYMSLARDAVEASAMAFLKLDAPCPPECAAKLRANPNVFSVITINKLGDGV